MTNFSLKGKIFSFEKNNCRSSLWGRMTLFIKTYCLISPNCLQNFTGGVKSDIQRIGRKRFYVRLFYINQTTWLLTFRLCSLLLNIKVIGKIIAAPLILINKIQSQILSIYIPYNAKIGKGLDIKHPIGIVINGAAYIGDNCTIFQNVTIGRNLGEGKGNATLEHHVVLCAGACVIGNVHIGHHTIIGANAVVTKDIPANCVAAGVPAKIITTDSSVIFNKENRYL